MNRLPWDLTYAGPVTLKDAVISGYDGGVKAPPGTYTVTLEAGGTTLTRPLEVVADPRAPGITQADYEEQYRLAAAIRDTATRVYDGLRRIRSVREQVVSIGERLGKADYPAELEEMTDTLNARLGAVEEELRQTKNESNQDALRYAPKLDTQYLNLYAYVTGEDNYRFGGPDGQVVTAKAGDAIIIPAGVSHKNLDSSPDFRCVGAYPAGQSPDMQYGEPGERPRTDQNIRSVYLPKTAHYNH